MKTCSTCARNFPDEYNFCLDDGEPLSGPIAGEATEVFKDSYPKNQRLAEQTVSQPESGPAPTVASSIPTIASRKPRVYSVDNTPEPTVSRSVLLTVISVLMISAAGGIYFGGIRPSDNNVSVANSASKAISASNTAPSVADAELSALGQVKFETTPAQVSTDYYDHVIVTSWKVKEGDVFNPCGSSILANIIGFRSPSADSGSATTLNWIDSAIIKKLRTNVNNIFNRSQPIVDIGTIAHVRVTAKLNAKDVKAIKLGAKCSFVPDGSSKVFHGTVDSVDRPNSEVHVLLDDGDTLPVTIAASGANKKCLQLDTNTIGYVHFIATGVNR